MTRTFRSHKHALDALEWRHHAVEVMRADMTAVYLSKEQADPGGVFTAL